MGWKQDFAPLYRKLMQELDVSSHALDMRVHRLTAARAVTPAEALVLIAMENGIAYGRAYQKLSADQQNRLAQQGGSIQQVINSRNVTQIAHSPRARAVTKTPSGGRPKSSAAWHKQWWFKSVVGLISAIIASIVSAIILAHLNS